MKYLTQENADNLDFIKHILLQNGFSEIKNVIRLKSGSRSLAYYADNYIVRFPKAEIIWQTIQREKNIIDTIYPYLPPTITEKIQKISLIDGEYPFSVSSKINGKICDGRPESEYATLYSNLRIKQQEKLAGDLAQFFSHMHLIDYKKLNISEPTEIIDNWDITLRDDFNFEKARQALLAYKIDLKNYRGDTPDTTVALCHNDLSGSNILLNTEREDVLVGIIDFGNAVVMPKYQDFFPLYKISRKLAVDTLTEYNKITSAPIEQKQIDFMALSYIGFGLAQSENVASPYFMKLLQPFL